METMSRATAAGPLLWSRRIIGALALITTLMLSDPALACHRFSFWAYKTPQRCGVARQMVRRPVLHSVAASFVTNQEHAGNEGGFSDRNELEIALPSLARADCDGGEADEPTRARVLLRAALEASNDH